MKKVLTIMMCLAIAMTAYSNNTEELELSGFFVSKANVKFEVAIVNNDDSRVVVQTKSRTFSYRIKLKIGQKYVITFMKGNKVKELYVNANEPGLMEVDVDFKTDNAAQICYNETDDKYNLTLLYTNE